MLQIIISADSASGLLSASLLAHVVTSLNGNLRALSRLFYSLAKDDILPNRFSKLNKKQIPANALLLVSLLSLIIPFFGSTAIGWIVDITTIGSTLIYGFVSAAAFKEARRLKDTHERITGLVGLVLMLVFVAYLLMPNIFSNELLKWILTFFLLLGLSSVSFISIALFQRITHVASAKQSSSGSLSCLLWFYRV